MTDDSVLLDELPKGYRYATFTGRMLASIIDTLLSIMLLVPLFRLVQGWLDMTPPSLQGLSQEEVALLLSDVFAANAVELAILTIIVLVFWAFKGGTPGKIILKMHIVDAQSYGRPAWWQLIIRYVGYYVSILPFCLGFVWMYYDKRHQAFHDKMARTIVIQKTRHSD